MAQALKSTSIKTLATASAVAPKLEAAPAKPATRPALRLGVCVFSYGIHWGAVRNQVAGVPFQDDLSFIEYCHSFGARGVQISMQKWDAAHARALRAKTEELEMYLEGQTVLPRDASDVGRFESELKIAREAGVQVVRTAMLSGRRYETFASAEEFAQFKARSRQAIHLAAPVTRQHGIQLAIENHKDWLVPEFLELLREVNSPNVGICVDTGNSIALMENPDEVLAAYAPYALSCHLKDMAVEPFEEGFLLSEIPLGQGYLRLRAMIEKLLQANPRLNLSLEMITRDPLKVPCLTDKYWRTMPGTAASALAKSLASIRQESGKRPLPRVGPLSLPERMALEDRLVQVSFNFARNDLKDI